MSSAVRRRRLLLLGVGLALAAGALLLSARRVAIDVPTPDAASERVCGSFSTVLPRTVEGQGRRAARPRSPLTAAWGDPAIVLRCGVAQPARLELTSELIEVDGVEWFAEQSAEGYVFTTVRRAANVEVRVPRAYAPEVNPLTDFAGAVQARLAPLPR